MRPYFIEVYMGPQVQFDVSKATARDLQPILAVMGKGSLSGLPKLLAALATACPAEWGDPSNEATWAKLPLNGDLKFAYGLLKQQIAAIDTKSITATFDLSALTASEFDDMVRQLQAGDPARQAALIARYAVESSVPGIKDEKLLMELSYYAQFRPLVTLLGEAGKNELENFKKAFDGF